MGYGNNNGNQSQGQPHQGQPYHGDQGNQGGQGDQGGKGPAPVADLVAVVTTQIPNGQGGSRTKDTFITLAPLWAAQTGSGNLSGSLEAEPVQWKDPMVSRRIIVQFRSRN